MTLLPRVAAGAVALAAALVLGPVVGTASAATPQAACNNGGFARYVDPGTKQPFTNQGTCVSFVARGGQLQPISRPTLEFTDVEPVLEGYESVHPYTYYLKLTGFAPNATVLLTYNFRDYSTTETVVVDGNGSYLRTYQNQGYCEDQVSIVASTGGTEVTFTPTPAYCSTV